MLTSSLRRALVGVLPFSFVSIHARHQQTADAAGHEVDRD